jgi:hypothetical protein
MAQYATALRNSRLDDIETVIGVSPVLKIFSGSQPGNCADSDPSGLLVTMTLPSTWLAAASGGIKSIAGLWSAAASAAGIAASWRIYDNGITACYIQGNTSEMVFDNTNIANGQTVTISSFSITSGNG